MINKLCFPMCLKCKIESRGKRLFLTVKNAQCYILKHQKYVQRKKAYAEMEEEVKDQLYYISTIPRTVQWFIYNGYSEIQAQEKAMEIYDAPLGTVLFHWKRYCKAQEKKKRENRNELIMTLMRAGLSNKEIGDKVGMHANSISRIITKTRVEYHSKK